jgi:antitoxin MazE
MQTELARWGNSLAVRIPKDVIKRASLREGDSLELSTAKTGEIKLTAKRRRARKELTLQQMLDQITPENMHERVDFGPPQGKELL